MKSVPSIIKPLFVYFILVAAVSCRKIPKSETPVAEAVHSNVPKGVPVEKRDPGEAFKKYWFAGEAEITSYDLQQARYGEMREGHAVLIFVTEPFRPDKQVKADQQQADNVQVLKLNSTKKFITGIYPYSIMSSTFYPVFIKQQALKVSASVQEWCGHVYMQLNNRAKFKVASYSYFESEGDQELELEKAALENEVWTQLRIDPSSLPTGTLSMVPSFEYLRLGHAKIQAYEVQARLQADDSISTYELTYPDLDRSLQIQFLTDFPHTIDNWSETYKSGFGPNARILTSTAKKIKTLKTTYWQQNGNKDVILRDSLGL